MEPLRRNRPIIIDAGSFDTTPLHDLPRGSVFTIPRSDEGWSTEREGTAYMVTDEQDEADCGCVQVVDLTDGSIYRNMSEDTKVTHYEDAAVALLGLGSDDEDED